MASHPIEGNADGKLNSLPKRHFKRADGCFDFKLHVVDQADSISVEILTLMIRCTEFEASMELMVIPSAFASRICKVNGNGACESAPGE